MRRVFRSLVSVFAIIGLMAPLAVVNVSAQLSDAFGGFPVNYDPAYVVGRSTSADSIDSCLKRKEFFYNEIYNIWVEGLVRCEKNSKGVLSKSTFQGISTTPVDEQACKGLREDQILVNGTPSENQARYWSEHCATNLGTVGGAGPARTTNVTSGTSIPGGRTLGTGGITLGGTPGTTTTPPPVTTRTPPTSVEFNQLTQYQAGGFTNPPGGRTDAGFRSLFESISTTQRSSLSSAQLSAFQQRWPVTGGGFNPVYTGPGVQVPGAALVATGISKETSLVDLIIFYTNVTLPYVSVISIFAFVVAGLYYILTFANEELNAKAKTIMIYVVIGIVIIMSSFTLVNVLLSLSSTAG